jgi:hypothetical protein
MFNFDFSFKKIPNLKLIYLLVAVLFLLTSYPFFIDFKLNWIPLALLDVIIPWLAVYLAADHKKNLFFASSLALPLAILSWLSWTGSSEIIIILKYSFAILFYGFATYIVLHQIIQKDVITVDIIVGSIATYLMLGLTWANIYALVDFTIVDSFRFATEIIENSGSQIDFLYYSFITLTNVGYGGIIPTSRYTRAFSLLESAAGVVFTAVVIGRVIGLYVSEKSHSVIQNLLD